MGKDGKGREGTPKTWKIRVQNGGWEEKGRGLEKTSQKGRDGKSTVRREGVHLADRGVLPRKTPPSLHDVCDALLRTGLGRFVELGGARVPRQRWLGFSFMCSWSFLGFSFVVLVFPGLSLVCHLLFLVLFLGCSFILLGCSLIVPRMSLVFPWDCVRCS